ncbi:MAG: hypothetical protein PHU24_03095 [Sphaerochaetaceae bacterium]|nr:hypothetical protein [Sphaerochaetaceae bacterium]NLO59915.1 hypothetical protein [Spirochaetales bacterium]MDD2405428.1 hypothetical protein [Sphaerochaetaceae bacterium]MDD3670147.1 hypothetical protein [Sphaerochaetaceae bacterium]MDD4259431.1 hypothetical protein [Sphaerochaetaceae bacterium]
MRKLSVVVLALVCLFTFSGCMSFAALFPVVNPPLESKSSMLVLEAGVQDGSTTSELLNTNATGWAPWVVDSEGNTIPFRPFDTESRLDSFYFAENLPAGTYTLKGFLHVYVDYSKLQSNEIASYGPFENYPYHVKQEFLLEQPVAVTLKDAEIATLGRYFITSQWVGGAMGTTDDRWKVAPSSVKITGDPTDKKALRVAKNWATPAWSQWNTRNPETAADR